MTEYVATKPIEYGNARAFNPGDRVPEANVRAHGYLEAGVVARVGSNAAEQATPEQVTQQPDRDASKSDWEAYARAVGGTEDQISGKTKAELVATFGN